MIDLSIGTRTKKVIMGETDSLIGHIVLSTQGRDNGQSYLVWQELDKDYVLLVDGGAKKIAKPKKKRKKHLQDTGMVLENIKTKILSKSKVFDAEIYSNLRKAEISKNQEEGY